MSEWISVKDRLPSGEQAYPCGVVLVKIVYESREEDYMTAQYNPPQPEQLFLGRNIPPQPGYWELGRSISFLCTITHWMPLPEGGRE